MIFTGMSQEVVRSLLRWDPGADTRIVNACPAPATLA